MRNISKKDAKGDLMDNKYCNDCPHCSYQFWKEPGDFIFQSDRYCSLVSENGEHKLLESWCTTGDKTQIPEWCPLK